MTTRKTNATAKARCGALRCAAHDETVSSFGRDDDLLVEEKRTAKFTKLS
jgi:hypothetical protein